jgi:hypothetical protein
VRRGASNGAAPDSETSQTQKKQLATEITEEKQKSIDAKGAKEKRRARRFQK